MERTSMAYGNRYRGDPYEIVARYAGTCARCGAAIPKGGAGFYYPNGRKLYGMACGCGETARADFSACAFDEDVAGNRSL